MDKLCRFLLGNFLVENDHIVMTEDEDKQNLDVCTEGTQLAQLAQ